LSVPARAVAVPAAAGDSLDAHDDRAMVAAAAIAMAPARRERSRAGEEVRFTGLAFRRCCAGGCRPAIEARKPP
jgi:hypothetical protein